MALSSSLPPSFPPFLLTVDDVVPEEIKAHRKDRVQHKQEEGKHGHSVVAPPLHISAGRLGQAHKDREQQQLHLGVHDGSAQEHAGGDGGLELCGKEGGREGGGEGGREGGSD